MSENYQTKCLCTAKAIENTLIVGILQDFNPDIHVIETGQNGLQLHIGYHYEGSASKVNILGLND